MPGSGAAMVVVSEAVIAEANVMLAFKLDRIICWKVPTLAQVASALERQVYMRGINELIKLSGYNEVSKLKLHSFMHTLLSKLSSANSCVSSSEKFFIFSRHIFACECWIHVLSLDSWCSGCHSNPCRDRCNRRT